MSTGSPAEPLRPQGGPKSFRRYLRPGPIVIACGMMAFAAWFVCGRDGVLERHKLRLRYAEQAKQIADLKNERDELEKYLDDLKSGDEAALERAARDYHMMAPGEKIYEVKTIESPTK